MSGSSVGERTEGEAAVLDDTLRHRKGRHCGCIKRVPPVLSNCQICVSSPRVTSLTSLEACHWG